MLPALLHSPAKPVTVVARVTETTSVGSVLEIRDPVSGFILGMEVRPVMCVSFFAVDTESGQEMKNLPGSGLDLIPGDHVRVTVEKM